MRGQSAHDALDGVAHELGRRDYQASRHEEDGGEEGVQAEDGTVRGDVLPFQVVLQASEQLEHLGRLCDDVNFSLLGDQFMLPLLTQHTHTHALRSRSSMIVLHCLFLVFVQRYRLCPLSFDKQSCRHTVISLLLSALLPGKECCPLEPRVPHYAP